MIDNVQEAGALEPRSYYPEVVLCGTLLIPNIFSKLSIYLPIMVVAHYVSNPLTDREEKEKEVERWSQRTVYQNFG